MTDNLSSPDKPSSEETNLPAHSEKAVASVVLGILGLFVVLAPAEWFGSIGTVLWFTSIPAMIVGLVLGCKALKTWKRGMAIVGMILNILGLAIAIIDFSIGFYLGYHGLL